MLIRKLVNNIMLAWFFCLLYTANVFGADEVKETQNFFEIVLSADNDADSEPSYIGDEFFQNDPIQQWLTHHGDRIKFGRIAPKDTPTGMEKMLQRKVLNNQIRMMTLVKNYTLNNGNTVNELRNAIDAALPGITFDDALMAARAFRHLKNFEAQVNHPLGDFISFYILSKKIDLCRDPIIRGQSKEEFHQMSRAQLSDAYYEMSQFYSHLVDFRGKDWRWGTSEEELHMQGELTDYGIRLISERIMPLAGIPRSLLLERKISLLKYSILNNLDNFSAWIRAMELAFFDLSKGEGPCGGKYCSVNLSMNFIPAVNQIKLINLIDKKHQEIAKKTTEDKSLHFLKEKESEVLLGIAKSLTEALVHQKRVLIAKKRKARELEIVDEENRNLKQRQES